MQAKHGKIQNMENIVLQHLLAWQRWSSRVFNENYRKHIARGLSRPPI